MSSQSEAEWVALRMSRINDVLQDIREEDIRSEVVKCRPDSSFKVHIPSKPEDVIAGGTNMHIKITFDDGTPCWLARIPILIEENTRQETKSEFATLQALRQAGVAVPAVFPSGRDLCGRAYFFVEYVDGIPWNHNAPGISDAKKATLIEHIAISYDAMSKAPFTGIGSLIHDAQGDIVVGPLCRNIPGPRETFKSTAARYKAEVDAVLKLLTDHNAEGFEGKEEQAYLFHLEVRRIITLDASLEDEGSPTYIAHGEPKEDIYMTREDGSIIGILDWHCFNDAFRAPSCLKDHRAFSGLDGISPSNALSEDQSMLVKIFERMGRQDLAAAMEFGQRFERLDACIYQSVKLEAVKALQATFGVIVDKESTMEIWMEMARQRFCEDEGYKAFCASQK